MQKIRGFPECYKAVCGLVLVSEIEWDQGRSSSDGQGRGICCESQSCCGTAPYDTQIWANSNHYPAFYFRAVHLCASHELGCTTKFAPIELTNIFNSGGTIQELEYSENEAKTKVKGVGIFLAYSTESPKKSHLNGVEVAFEWSRNDSLWMFLGLKVLVVFLKWFFIFRIDDIIVLWLPRSKAFVNKMAYEEYE